MPVLKATEIKLWILWKEGVWRDFNLQFYTNKKHRIKKKIVLVLVRSVKFLSDATIPFQIKPWEYEDWMKNSDEKVNAMHKAVFRCEGLLTYVNNNRNASFNVIF